MSQEKRLDVSVPRNVRLALCVVGLMVFFLTYGVIQEKIMTTPYGPNGEKFTDTALLVFINRLISIILALIILTVQQKETFAPIAPLHYYFYISASNFLSTFCQYEALKYVTFPTQTLGKCGKMIPVLVIGSLFQNKRYTWKEYLIALSITLGCTLFLTGGSVSTKKGAENDTPIGLLLILGYLFFDGFTSTTQENLFKSFKMSTYNQMLYVNLSSAVLGLVALVFPVQDIVISFFTGNTDTKDTVRLGPAIDFALTYPQMLKDAIVLSLCSSLGQLIIYYTIKQFGALIYSTIMTTRQFVAIFLSAIIFVHPITGSQWMGATFVFGAIYAQSYLKSSNHKPRDKKDMEEGEGLPAPNTLRSNKVTA